jgi:hypothetical protein
LQIQSIKNKEEKRMKVRVYPNKSVVKTFVKVKKVLAKLNSMWGNEMERTRMN